MAEEILGQTPIKPVICCPNATQEANDMDSDLEKLRQTIMHHTQQLLNLSLESQIIQKILLQKGITTEAELAQAVLEVHAEAKEAMQKVANAMRQDPPEGIQ
jgi:hypothetical protein